MQGIDVAHAKFIHGLVASAKPKNILEFGYGAGISCEAICSGVSWNRNMPRLTIVDSWHDWSFKQPDDVEALTRIFKKDFSSIDIITSEERHFVHVCIPTPPNKFDFIMSDGDHQHAHEWSKYVFDEMLAPGGWLIYHDVDGAYRGLQEMRQMYLGRHSPASNVFVFDQSTRPDEECKRGLLVIQK
jgi:predicted O-methyltransferase YrrM